MAGGLGKNDIYLAERTFNCEFFKIESFTGSDTIINPLPLSGQAVKVTGSISGVGNQSLVKWTLLIGDKLIQEGTGTSIDAEWNGRNAEGVTEAGNYNLILLLQDLDVNFRITGDQR